MWVGSRCMVVPCPVFYFCGGIGDRATPPCSLTVKHPAFRGTGEDVGSNPTEGTLTADGGVAPHRPP